MRNNIAFEKHNGNINNKQFIVLLKVECRTAIYFWATRLIEIVIFRFMIYQFDA